MAIGRRSADLAAVKRFAAVLLLLALGPLPEPVANLAARAVGVSDGDTPTVMTAEERQVRVRLRGIDPPQTGQDFGTRAKPVASELASDWPMTITTCKLQYVRRTMTQLFGTVRAARGVRLILPEPFAP